MHAVKPSLVLCSRFLVETTRLVKKTTLHPAAHPHRAPYAIEHSVTCLPTSKRKRRRTSTTCSNEFESLNNVCHVDSSFTLGHRRKVKQACTAVFCVFPYCRLLVLMSACLHRSQFCCRDSTNIITMPDRSRSPVPPVNTQEHHWRWAWHTDGEHWWWQWYEVTRLWLRRRKLADRSLIINEDSSSSPQGKRKPFSLNADKLSLHLINLSRPSRPGHASSFDHSQTNALLFAACPTPHFLSMLCIRSYFFCQHLACST